MKPIIFICLLVTCLFSDTVRERLVRVEEQLKSAQKTITTLEEHMYSNLDNNNGYNMMLKSLDSARISQATKVERFDAKELQNLLIDLAPLLAMLGFGGGKYVQHRIKNT